MNERSAWHVVGLGVGGVFASVAGWTLGAFWHEATTADYLRVMLLTFIGAGAFGIIAYEFPALYVMVWHQIRQAELLKLDAATFARKRANLRFEYPEATGSPVLDTRTREQDTTVESWRVFYVDSVTYCLRALSGDPLYKSSELHPGMDRIMDFATWRIWADPLVRSGILDPIFQGARTRWADTWSAARVLGKLEEGWLPAPLPQGNAPALKPYNSENIYETR